MKTPPHRSAPTLRLPSSTMTNPSTSTCTPPWPSPSFARRAATFWRGGWGGVGGRAGGGFRGVGRARACVQRKEASWWVQRPPAPPPPPTHTHEASPPLTRPHPPLRSLPPGDYRYLRSLVVRTVLATDMARHHEQLEEFRACLRLWGPDLRCARASTCFLSVCRLILWRAHLAALALPSHAPKHAHACTQRLALRHPLNAPTPTHPPTHPPSHAGPGLLTSALLH